MRTLFPTKAQIEAARRNGALSRGPLTPQTRAKSAQNARKHGLCARTVLLPGESQERFQLLYDDLYDEFQPQTTSEYLQFETLVAAAWRQLRARAHETALLADELAQGAGSSHQAWARSTAARLLQRYETAHRRTFDSARRELLAAWLTREALGLGTGFTPEDGENGTPVFRNEPGTPQTREAA